ncbi:MAG TPA: glycosyltransferase [Flavobacteriales bacterium]|nr:glycosyltransferase [Flavobacteriales bacterium]
MNSASSKKSPCISVIIPSYNQLRGLKKTIKAFSSLRRIGLELIVVDGTSTDGSSEWINSNASDIDQMIIEPDTGIYDAMNKGLELANGDWVWFMGTGDLPVLEGVEEILEVVKGSTSDFEESDPKMLAFGVHLLAPREPGVPEYYKPVWNSKLVWRNTIHHQGAIYSRELFKSDAYDLRFRVLSDYHFQLKLWKKGVECSCFPAIIAEVATGGVSRDFSLSLYKEERTMKRDVLSGWEIMIQEVWTRAKWLRKKVKI